MFKAKIVDKQEVAGKTLRVVFEPEVDIPPFKAGQYMFLNLPKLNYPDERGSRRQFSIVSSPSNLKQIAMTTRISESGFKKTLAELPIGSEVEIVFITGNFVLPDDTSRPLAFIAGGIGITPFMSMLQFVTEKNLPYDITLFYSNGDVASTAYYQDLINLQKQNSHIKIDFIMTHDPTWKGDNRHLDEAMLKQYIPDLLAVTFMIVGPPPMVEATQKLLSSIGIDPQYIKTEQFTGYA